MPSCKHARSAHPARYFTGKLAGIGSKLWAYNGVFCGDEGFGNAVKGNAEVKAGAHTGLWVVFYLKHAVFDAFLSSTGIGAPEIWVF